MINILKEKDTEKNYIRMVKTVEDFLATEKDITANLANITAIIKSYMDDLNWVGFYILKEGDLVLGPFQGLPACIRIKPGKGVCFAAIEQNKTLVVDDVDGFPGHIACDAATKSELVCPIYKKGKIYGVLDLDSPLAARFTCLEVGYIEKIGDLIGNIL